MKVWKAVGEDRVMVESIKYGGPKMRSSAFKVARAMWIKAVEVGEGLEAVEWPEHWESASSFHC